ncbi:MAG: response regulator transcription factor [Rhodospirillales bacterium]|jgi:DNA-binding response OmpR family regulator|nr:response regulator transcription factor [Rhodospirillales bacterium]
MSLTNKAEYQNVRLAIGDPNRDVRLTLLSQLNPFGFRGVLHSDELRYIRNAVIKDSVDLIIFDEILDKSFSNFVNDIRHQRIGNNPFIIIIATTNHLTAEKVKRLTDAGVDDVIGKPLSVSKLMERVQTIAKSRKPFVVTTDYTGPDRRKGFRPGRQEVPLIDAPNPLVYLMGKPKTKLEIAEIISEASTVVNEQKMERHAFQIGFLINRILPLYKSDDTDDINIDDIDHLIAVSNDINSRLEGSRYSGASALCKSMVDLADRVRLLHPSPKHKDLELMPELSQAIQLAFLSEDEDTSSVQEIVDNLNQQSKATIPDNKTVAS